MNAGCSGKQDVSWGAMFRRDSSTQPDSAVPSTPPADDRTSGKGRPTPTRKEAEAARKQRVKPTLNKREARKRQREANRAERDSTYRAMQAGDESHFPARDRGPVRRYVRDMVDGRRLLTEFFLPVMIGILALSLLPIPALVQSVTLLWLAAIALVFAELTWLGFKLRKGIAERFPDDTSRGNVMYGIIRATQLRRLRLPKPAVKPGQRPRG
jgi:hypothetical protein